MKRNALTTLAAVAIAVLSAGEPVAAQEHLWERPTLSFMGMPGLFDMPTAHQMKDADLSLTLAGFETAGRTTLRFQITDRLAGAFRYSYVDDFLGKGNFYDRSFDLSYLLLEETQNRPALQIGLQDFGGTSIYAAEYIVATKTFGALRTSVGLGWGRFGTQNGFGNPLGALSGSFETRPETISGIDSTGQLDTGNWFRGDAALFGGLEYAVNRKLRLALEYSSDAYEAEEDRIGFEVKSPVNFGFSYAFDSGMNLKAGWMYGTRAGVQLSYVLNAKAPVGGALYRGRAPAPVAVRSAAELGWGAVPRDDARIEAQFAAAIAPDGLTVEGFELASHAATIQFRNRGGMAHPQAIGRMARVLTRLLPAAVEHFEFIAVTSDGVPAARISLRRSDLEELEFAPDGAWQIFARSQITDAGDVPIEGHVSRPFVYSLEPYVLSSYFDPDAPLRFEAGVQARARYEPTAGLVFSGLIRQRLLGNREDLPASNSEIERVRSDNGLYAEGGETALVNLTMSKYFRPAENLYGRVSAGYFETMYGGVSAEVLWKPVDSRLALGFEVNYARQRSFEQDFDFRDYDVLTGHASAYYKTQGGFHYQLDLGRYLAGDWGGTLAVDREFANGIRVGAFATLTDVSYDDFGEGSFDKGIRVTIPLSALTGRRTSGQVKRTIRPVLRDGGARLDMNGRLYENVRSFHQPALQDRWGRFWR